MLGFWRALRGVRFHREDMQSDSVEMNSADTEQQMPSLETRPSLRNRAVLQKLRRLEAGPQSNKFHKTVSCKTKTNSTATNCCQTTETYPLLWG